MSKSIATTEVAKKNESFVANVGSGVSLSSSLTPLAKTKITTNYSNYNNNNNNNSGSLVSQLDSQTNYKQRPYKSLSSSQEATFFLLIMRLNLRAVLLTLSAAVIVITLFVYIRCSDINLSHELLGRRLNKNFYAVSGSGDILLNQKHLDEKDATKLLPKFQPIECRINHEYNIACQWDVQSNEVYVPFSFIHEYFDITGTLSGNNNNINNNNENNYIAASEAPPQEMLFNWMHSTSKINIPKGIYNAHGVYMYFENYNVEVRDRVKCISAAEGVPISTQWEKRGYFYPTQIAQFALSHYSKNITESLSHITVLEDGYVVQGNWHLPHGSNLTRISHPKFNTTVVQYETSIGYDSAIKLRINTTTTKLNDLVLSVNMLLATNSSSLMVTVAHHDTNQQYRLHYIPADLVLSVQDEHIYYGLGVGVSLNKWRHLTRDLCIDVLKGLAAAGSTNGGNVPKNMATPMPKIKRSDLRIVSVAFLGIGFFDNLTLSTHAHMSHFYDAAEWFVNHQNAQTGGWPNPVRRNLNGFNQLKSGWLSAMGQGHAISVLARAYKISGGDRRYLNAASLALKPFSVPSHNGGVLAHFMDKYAWYEEYPTTPASFVLNGFIYSLLGLYDLQATAPSSIAKEARKLFEQGLVSLKKMLLLYDTGSGTSYDLRHLSLGVAPNLARWDYHATHVNQLLLLATIDSDPFIARTAERWKGYMLGHRAKHN